VVTVLVVNSFMVDYLQVNKTLQKLGLKENELGPEGAVPLAEALKVRTSAHVHMPPSNPFTTQSHKDTQTNMQRHLLHSTSMSKPITPQPSPKTHVVFMRTFVYVSDVVPEFEGDCKCECEYFLSLLPGV